MYRAPVSDIGFTLDHIAGLSEARALDPAGAPSGDIVAAVLEEAGRFAGEQIAPLNRAGDLEGARLGNAGVETSDEWQGAYRAWRDAGWMGLSVPEAIGGQGLPLAIAAATQEMWTSACMSFALCPMLTMGAIEAVERHGTETLKRLYLPRLVSGEWTGTMNLTEPQAGSDVGALTTRAEPQDDGSYRLFGQKIFITYGEHDLADNIVHLVLARLPGAPVGSKGISLFLVPRMLVREDGSLGERNDLFCASLEHKLGIHGSPTCTMIYGDGRFGDTPGAVGWLVGEENRGLACMFTMMNNARLMVGIQGVSQAELALQQATDYALERRQGRAPGETGSGMSLIAAHPDVRRTLMSMRALTAAARAICYACAWSTDRARAEGGGGWQARADLLTPVAKAFATDIGFEVASLGVQVHGGAGYIEETGAAQTLRDARIAPIYEGTNGIQAIDLVTRKLPIDRGAHVGRLVTEFRDVAEQVRAVNRPETGAMGARLAAALDDLEAATTQLLSTLQAGKTSEALAVATPYLRLFGLAAGAGYLARGALAALHDTAPEAALRVATARYFAEHLAPETAGLRIAVTEGADSVLALDPALFAA